MTTKQNGYIQIDFMAIIAYFFVVGAIIGVIAWNVIGWLWPIVKAWLHAVTA